MSVFHADGYAGFHDGELAVQRRAGAGARAAQLAGMLAPADLHEGAARFLAQRRLLVVSARDTDRRLWVTALEGPEGFLEAGPDWLRIHATPQSGDPLHGIAAGGPVGLITIDFATRRRFRMNGTLVAAGPDELGVTLDQAYGNCPKYIHPRALDATDANEPGPRTSSAAPALAPEQTALTRGADTFFLGTTHPDRGNDASHRGGPVGFVEVHGAELRWPDFVGNDMFNSFGNLAVDPSAALFFADWRSHRTLHLSGQAAVQWDAPTETGRAVRFAVEAVQDGVALQYRER